MKPEELKELILSILSNKKALDLQCIDVKEKTTLGDYFIIASATSTPHVKSMADEVEFKLKKDRQILPQHIEGLDTGRWVLLDYGDVIVHIFHKDEREYYSLEKLWLGAKPLSDEQ